MSTYAEEIRFVLSETTRIMSMEPRTILKLPFQDAFATLPHPSGSGIMICGAAAHHRLSDLVNLALSRSKFAGRLDSQEIFNRLKKIIVKRFIQETRELNTKEADRAVSAAIKGAARKITDLIHFFPCHLVQDEASDSFSIGPVTFHQREKAFNHLEPALQAYLNKDRGHANEPGDEEEGLRLEEILLADAREYYESFDWIAEVRIPDCDPATSKVRAKLIIQSALDCFHVLIGASHSYRMRIGGPNYKKDKRSKIEIGPDNVANVSSSVSWHGNHLGDGWWDMLNSEGRDGLIKLMGVAIEAGHDVRAPAPLSQRFLDGIAWYGEAVRDEFSASRLVKYVTAIERILTTRKEDNLNETLANRGAALIFDPDLKNLDQLRKQFRKVYDLRSRIVHGSRSPLEAGLGSGLQDAENIAQRVLLISLQFFREEGLSNRAVTAKTLDEAYDQLLKWADALESASPH